MGLYTYPGNELPIDSGDRSARSHLTYLKKVADAIDLGWWLHNRMWSADTTGRLSYGPQNDDSLKIVATGSPSMQVTVKLGAGFLLGKPFRKVTDTTISALTPPTTDDRIDTIGIDPVTGAVIVYTGEEHPSPTAPFPATGIFKAGEIYLRPGSAYIYDSPASAHGYIQNLADIFSLPGEEPHTSGLTVSGGAFVFDGTSGDITLPVDGLSIEFDYAGEVNVDATNAAGYIVLRTGGSTDRLTLGAPADPIILHGSSHDIHLSADGETLLSSGPNDFKMEASDGGIHLRTDATLRYEITDDGYHNFIGSGATTTLTASGASMETTQDGAFSFKATHANGGFSFKVGNDDTPMAYLNSGGFTLMLGTLNDMFLEPNGVEFRNDGESQFIINQTGAAEGIMLQTNSEDRYQIDESGRHDIWGDAHFHNDVYIDGTLYIDGVAFTGDGGGDSTGYATITLPGTVFEPASSGGSGGPDSEEFGSNVLLFQSFLNAADGYCMAPNVLMPLNYNDTQSVYVRVRWSANSTSANQVRFLAYTAPQGEGDAANQSLNTAAVILDSNGTTANQMRVSDWVALPVNGIAAGDAFALRIDRTPTHADDTLAADVRVHSVDIRYTRGVTV